MTFKPVNAFSRQLIPPDLKILDVELGIGIIKSVLLAQTIGLSTLRTFVFQFQTNALHIMLLEIALLAIKDMT